MSVLSSTHSGRKAIPITLEYFDKHKDMWFSNVLEVPNEIIFTYKMKLGLSITYRQRDNTFYTHIWNGKSNTILTNLYQIDMLKKYFEAKEPKDYIKYAALICQS